MKKKSGKPVQRKGTWAYLNGAKTVKMFKAGKSVPDIAEKFGDRSKQNRVRAALLAAGVYQYKHAAAAKKAKRTK